MSDTGGLDTFGLLVTGAVTALIFFITYRHLKIFSFWSSRGIPGPQPWPFLGTNVYYIFKKRVIQDDEWHAKYGKTFGCYEGLLPVLRTIDNDIIKHVFIKDFANFNERPNQFVMSDKMNKWLFFSPGAHWANQRAIISPLFTGANMKSMYNGIASGMDRLSEEIKKRFQVDPTNKVTLSKDELMALNVDIVATTFFSIKLNTYRDKTSEFFKRAFAFSNFDVPYFTMWLFMPTFLLKALNMDPIPSSQYEYFDKLSQTIIDDRRKRAAGDKKSDLVQSLIDAELPEDPSKVFDKEEGEQTAAHYNDGLDEREVDRLVRAQSKKISFRKFDDSEIKGHTTFFFLAGFETTSSSLTYCFYQLAHSPAIQEELLQELRALGRSSSSEIEYSDIGKLVKLDAFISETFRIFPPVIDISRKVTNPQGVHLPIGERSIYLPYDINISATPKPLHYHSDYWSEPERFDITRFYPENKHKLKSCTFMPFGVGPRYCAGTRFALTNMKATLSRVLLDYEIVVGQNSKPYPPEYLQHTFFLQFKHTDFTIIPRQKTEAS